MARPLTQQNKEGQAYTRPPDVEANIDGAIDAPLDTLRRRLQLASSTDADFLKSECIVHLIRLADERGDEERIGVLYPLLIRRVERTLLSKIPDGDLPDAADVRQDVMDSLGELFAQRGTRLDYYEVHFNHALRNLYLMHVRRARKRADHVVIEDPPENSSAAIEPLDRRLREIDVASAIKTLSKEERDALLLVDEFDYEIESEDPTKTTVSTICKVTGRTVRNRRASAKTKLAKLLKDYSHE